MAYVTFDDGDSELDILLADLAGQALPEGLEAPNTPRLSLGTPTGGGRVGNVL